MVESVKKYFEPVAILDIGANIGQFSCEAKNHFPDAFFFLIEPNPYCQDIIKTLGFPYYIGAVSDIEKEITFYMSKVDPLCTGNSLYREVTSFFSSENLIEHKLKTTTLDILFDPEGPLPFYFDLIKIDTQGSELDILKGGINTLRKGWGVILEVAVNRYNIGAPMCDEVFDFMDKHGFEKKEKVGSNSNPDTHELVHEDYLFINRIRL